MEKKRSKDQEFSLAEKQADEKRKIMHDWVEENRYSDELADFFMALHQYGDQIFASLKSLEVDVKILQVSVVEIVTIIAIVLASGPKEILIPALIDCIVGLVASARSNRMHSDAFDITEEGDAIYTVIRKSSLYSKIGLTFDVQDLLMDLYAIVVEHDTSTSNGHSEEKVVQGMVVVDAPGAETKALFERELQKQNGQRK